MDEKKIFMGKILTFGLTAIIAVSVLFIGLYEVSASLNIQSINFIGSNSDLKINVTIKNTDAGTSSTYFNLTLKDTSNDDEDNQVIYSGSLSIDANKTQSYTFGIYGSYDKHLTYPSNWENYRCGKHTIQAKITIAGSSQDTKTEDIDLSADTFGLTFFPDIETGKISLKDRVYINVKDIDGKAISGVYVKISYGDVKKTVGTTSSTGRVSFRISELFSSPSVGTYTLNIFKHEKFKEHYYCNYEKDFQVKKKLNISSISPANPKINERITLTIDADDYADYYGVFLSIMNMNNHSDSQYITLNDKTQYFTIANPGTYKIHLTKSIDYWDAERTLVIEENPELKISFNDIVLGKENEFVVLDANDVRVPNAKVTLSGVSKTSDNKGVVKFTITNPGTYEITAEKTNYKTGQKTFAALKKLKIAYEPEKPKIYDDIQIKLLDESDSPVDGTITINSKAFSTQAGNINYNFTMFVNYKIIGKAQNFADVEVNLKPLKILALNINKAENEEFSVGDDLSMVLEGDRLGEAKIEIKNLDTNTTTSTTTSAKNYSVPLLIPGNYEITATANGFGDTKKKFSVRHMTIEMNAKYDAQNNKILIKVTSDGKGLENATIFVKTPKNLLGQYTTNIDGQAIFDAICEQGNYTVAAEKIHYEPKQQIVEVKKQNFDFGIVLPVAIVIIVLLIIVLLYLMLKKKRPDRSINQNPNEIQEGKLG